MHVISKCYKYLVLIFIMAVSFSYYNEREKLRHDNFIKVALQEFVNDLELQKKLTSAVFFQDIEMRLDRTIKYSYEYSKKDLNLMLYSSVDEFLKSNQDCCVAKKLRNGGKCNVPGEIYSKNINSYCVYINYLIQYKDESGTFKKVENLNYHSGNKVSAMISSDGKILEWNKSIFIG